MRLILALACSFLLAGCGRAQTSQAGPESPPAKAVSLSLVPVRNPAATIKVSSDGVGADGSIDRRYTSYGDNLSLPVGWTPAQGALTYAVVVEDPDAAGDTPFVHWLIWNIPSNVTALPAGVPGGLGVAGPGASAQGLNGVGDTGYFGPRPPAGTGVHHYHIQVFALDSMLTLTGGADIRALIPAMRGHVIAEGELVGTVAAPPMLPPIPARAD